MCPCKPAIEKEIPEEGICHCQIFCTPVEYKEKQLEKMAEKAKEKLEKEAATS